MFFPINKVVPIHKKALTYIFNWSFYYEKILADKLRINNSLYNRSLYFAKKVFSNVLRNCSSMGINKKTVDEIVQVLKEMNASKTRLYPYIKRH